MLDASHVKADVLYDYKTSANMQIGPQTLRHNGLRLHSGCANSINVICNQQGLNRITPLCGYIFSLEGERICQKAATAAHIFTLVYHGRGYGSSGCCFSIMESKDSSSRLPCPFGRRWGSMMDKPATYAPKRGGAVVEDTVCGLSIVVHTPRNTDELEKRVAQAHADAIIAKAKKLNRSAKQKKELIDSISI